MLGNINSSDSNERRPSAELLWMRQRLSEIDIATQSEHVADLRTYPNLNRVIEQPVTAPTVIVPEGVAGNVINLAEQRDARVLSEQEQRVANAREAADEARKGVDYEFAA